MSRGIQANPATCATCPRERNRSAIPRWSRTSMVRECRPPAREPARSWLARCSTMATSTPANANSAASISPVGPPPAITTACSVIATLRPASRRSPPAHHIPRPPRRPCRTARRPTRPRAGAGPPPTAASPRSPAGAPAGRLAPTARRHGPAAPRSPAARTPAPPRRVPATAPRVPPSVRRPRATHTSTTTHASRYPDFRRFWLRPALCGTTRGLTQAPRFAIYWKWKGVGTLLSTFRPLWTDNLLAKRRRAAYGGTQTPRNTSAPPSKLITLLKPLICFRVPTRLAKQSTCDSNCRQNRVGQRRNRPRLRGIRLTYGALERLS